MKALRAPWPWLFILATVGTVATAEGQNVAPPARAHSAMVFDPVRGRVLLAGGGTQSGNQWITLGDLWSWDGSRWERLPIEGLSRSGHKLVYHGERRAVLAVAGNDNAEFERALLALENDRWVALGADSLPARTEAAVAYDPIRHRLVVFGGIFNRTFLGTTHEFDGTRWHEITAPGPAPRLSAMMAFHPRSGKIILAGGAGDQGKTFSDTWTWNGTAWTQVDSLGPGPLMGAGIASDDARGELVVFGGAGASGLTGATWIWDGARWEQRQVTGPSPRVLPAMAYDPVRRVVVLFGGRTDGQQDSNETWEWNGQSWTRRPYLASPVGAQTRRATDAPALVTRLADEYVTEYLDANPEQETFEGVRVGRHGALADNTLGAVKRWQQREDEWLRQVRAVNPAHLVGTPEWITYGYLLERLESGVATRACRSELWTVSAQTGWQTSVGILADMQPVGTDSARAQALARFRQLPKYIDNDIANLREGLRLGYSAARPNVEQVLGQVNDLLRMGLDQHPYASPMRRDTTAVFVTAWRALLAEQVTPAVTRYRDFIQQEYLPRARTGVGVANLPGGRECYAGSLRFHTTLGISPDSVHALGLAEVARITAEMQDVAQRAVGSPDIGAVYQQSAQRPEYRFSSREDMLAFATRVIERASAAMPKVFGRLTRTPVEVVSVKPNEEATAAFGSYLPAAEDGSRPGRYQLKTVNPTQQNGVGLETLTFHEAVPGHHWQMSLARERPQAHRITRLFYSTAFVEGWALYSERLADELQLFTSDATRMSMLGSQRFRAARLAVDTGIHWKNWTRDQAIQYMREAINAGPGIAVEIDRYIALPGQATAYMIGNLEIRRLRNEAERRLGGRFDLRAFHDEVLGDGGVTLGMLQAKVQRWIAAR